MPNHNTSLSPETPEPPRGLTVTLGHALVFALCLAVAAGVFAYFGATGKFSFGSAKVGAPYVTITANPGTISSGGSSTLKWFSTGAKSCIASGGWSGKVPKSGSQSVSPVQTTDYHLTCSGNGGQTTRSATVIVTGTFPICGNGILEQGEQCDVTALGGQTCQSLGYTGGMLTCNANCTFNTNACTSGSVEVLPGLKGAFIGDTGVDSNATKVLELIKQEKADFVVHAGDFDYGNNPLAFEQWINNTLGVDFPYFITPRRT